MQQLGKARWLVIMCNALIFFFRTMANGVPAAGIEPNIHVSRLLNEFAKCLLVNCRNNKEHRLRNVALYVL